MSVSPYENVFTNQVLPYFEALEERIGSSLSEGDRKILQTILVSLRKTQNWPETKLVPGFVEQIDQTFSPLAIRISGSAQESAFSNPPSCLVCSYTVSRRPT
jgi:hypothetical protein